MQTAAELGGRFAIITGGERWVPMLGASSAVMAFVKRGVRNLTAAARRTR